MSGPPRLRHQGGIAQRLLESASLDRPSLASRAKAADSVATASAFARTTSGRPQSRRRAVASRKAPLVWLSFAAVAASVGLGMFASRWLTDTDPRSGAPLLSASPAPSEIAPEISPELVPSALPSSSAASSIPPTAKSAARGDARAVPAAAGRGGVAAH